MHVDGVMAILDTGGFTWPGENIQLAIGDIATGWPVVHYQIAFAGASRDDWLAIDGIAGPKTQRAMEDYGQRLSPHFWAREFECSHCGRNGVRRELVAGLQVMRDALRQGVAVRSGYRCPEHPLSLQRPGSMHPKGLAADLSPMPLTADVRKLMIFSGLGTAARGSRLRHVDVRHVLPAQERPGTTPRVTVGRPDVWRY